MRYMVFFTRGEWEDHAPEAQRMRRVAEIDEWSRGLLRQGKLVTSHQLGPPYTATTVAFDGRAPHLADGPLADGSDALTRCCLLDLPDLDAALAVVRSFPSSDSKAEIRPVIEPTS